MKYTKDYKKQIVEKYLKSKESLMAFVRKNNIPKTTLQDWIKIYNKYGPNAYTDSNTRKTYTLQEKANLVELYLTEDITLTEFAKSHAIPPMSFQKWVSEYYLSYLPEYLKRGKQTMKSEHLKLPKFKNYKEKSDYFEKEFKKSRVIIEEKEIQLKYLKELRRLRLMDPKMQQISLKQELPKTSEDHTN